MADLLRRIVAKGLSIDAMGPESLICRPGGKWNMVYIASHTAELPFIGTSGRGGGACARFAYLEADGTRRLFMVSLNDGSENLAADTWS